MPKPNTKCFICSKPIYRVPCRLSDHNVCSYACRNKYFSKERSFVWKDGDRKYNGRKSETKRRQDYKLKAMALFDSKCCVCSYEGCPASFDFHHRNPVEKEFTMKDLYYGKWENIEKELKKCVLLCANCHREHHWKEKNESSTYKCPF